MIQLYPDRIFCNGQVITMAEDYSSAQAVAVMNGIVVAIGDDEDVKDLEGSDTEIIDLNGQTFFYAGKGSIKVGKLADFVVLDRDLFQADPMEVKDIEVVETIVGGKSVFSR